MFNKLCSVTKTNLALRNATPLATNEQAITTASLPKELSQHYSKYEGMMFSKTYSKFNAFNLDTEVQDNNRPLSV